MAEIVQEYTYFYWFVFSNLRLCDDMVCALKCTTQTGVVGLKRRKKRKQETAAEKTSGGTYKAFTEFALLLSLSGSGGKKMFG